MATRKQDLQELAKIVQRHQPLQEDSELERGVAQGREEALPHFETLGPCASSSLPHFSPLLLLLLSVVDEASQCPQPTQQEKEWAKPVVQQEDTGFVRVLPRAMLPLLSSFRGSRSVPLLLRFQTSDPPCS